MLTTKFKLKLLFIFGWSAMKRILQGNKRNSPHMGPSHPEWNTYKSLRLETLHAGIAQVKKLETRDNQDIVMSIVADYRSMELQLMNDSKRIDNGRQENAEWRELELKAIQAERNEIQALFEQGEISRNLANSLRMDVNYREAHLFETQTVHGEELAH